MINQSEPIIDRSLSAIEWFIVKMFEDYEKKNISYCVLRNYERMPKDHGNDLDILVKKNDFKKTVSCVRNLAKKFRWRVLAVVNPFGMHKIYLYNNMLDSVLIVDLFKDISWKGIDVNSKIGRASCRERV